MHMYIIPICMGVCVNNCVHVCICDLQFLCVYDHVHVSVNIITRTLIVTAKKHIHVIITTQY